MKKILKSEWVIIVILLLLIAFGVNYHFTSINKKDSKYETEVKLREALQDSVRTHINDKGELVSEKRTLQGEINDLTSKNVKLNADQKELLNRVKSEKNKNNIITAALIKSEIRIDSLNNLVANVSEIDTVNNTVSFIDLDTTKHFNYNLLVTGVKPASTLISPTLEFKSIYFPNTQFITFQFDKNERKDYPVSFSVTNTNQYLRITNIESYAIPTLKKEIVNPTGWQKVWKFVKVNGKYIIIGAGGFALGKVL